MNMGAEECAKFVSLSEGCSHAMLASQLSYFMLIIQVHLFYYKEAVPFISRQSNYSLIQYFTGSPTLEVISRVAVHLV